jgi:hypothetical protein
MLYKEHLVEEKGELLTTLNQENVIEARVMVEEIFTIILDSSEGDYIFKVQLLAVMKPAGW